VSSGTERDTEVTIWNRGNVVFPVNVPKDAPLPKTFMGRPVVDGDKHDLRFLDPHMPANRRGFAVLVRMKGNNKDTHGFIREVS
jgi:hypothetical protein